MKLKKNPGDDGRENRSKNNAGKRRKQSHFNKIVKLDDGCVVENLVFSLLVGQCIDALGEFISLLNNAETVNYEITFILLDINVWFRAQLIM